MDAAWPTSNHDRTSEGETVSNVEHTPESRTLGA
jgi:hypothetical protein